MKFGKHRLGLIGLCVTAALGLMAFSAAAAQAEVPSWMIAGKTINLPEERTVNLVVTPETASGHPLVLLSKASGQAIEIQCETVEATNEKILGDGVAHGTVNFTKCETRLEKKLSTACKPKEPISATGLLLVVLHEKVTYVLAEPETGKPFTTITLGAPRECSVGEKFEVKGQLWIKDCKGDPETELLVHLVEEGTVPAAALGGLKFGAEPASIDGSAEIELFEGGVMKEFSVLAA